MFLRYFVCNLFLYQRAKVHIFKEFIDIKELKGVKRR